MSRSKTMGDPLSNKLQVQEYLNSANISNDDVDYYLNITGLLWPEIRTGQEDYCGIPIQRIRSSFQLAHGCLSLIICLVGVVVNILNIVVLSQKELRRNNINRILCSLAVADFLLMCEYIPFSCHMYLFPQRSLDVFYSYPWAVFVLFHAHFTLVAHTVSIWLTLSLAVWRWNALRNGRQRQGGRCHQERCTLTIVSAYLGSIILCIPSFVTFGIEQQEIADPLDPSAPNLVIYKVNLNPIAKHHDDLVHKAHLWVYSVLMKLGPCLVLTLLTCWLVRRLWEAERHRQCMQNRFGPGFSTDPGIGSVKKKSKRTSDVPASAVQVSITQQLEMRQLASAMAQDTDVQIVITEASINTERSSSSIVESQPNNVAMHISAASTPTIKAMTSQAGKVPASGIISPASVSSRGTRTGAIEINAAVPVRGGPTSARDTAGFQMGPSPFPSAAVNTDSANSETPAKDNDARHVSIMAGANNPDATSEAAANSADVHGSEPVENPAIERTASTRSQVVHALNTTQSMRRKHQTDRTTRMLVAVLILFLVTEIPQGIMALLSGVLGRHFFTHCYNGLGEFLDLLALLNSTINFLLYCSMSRQFRTHFQRLFVVHRRPTRGASRLNDAPVQSQTNNKPISPTNQSKFTNL